MKTVSSYQKEEAREHLFILAIALILFSIIVAIALCPYLMLIPVLLFIGNIIYNIYIAYFVKTS